MQTNASNCRDGEITTLQSAQDAGVSNAVAPPSRGSVSERTSHDRERDSIRCRRVRLDLAYEEYCQRVERGEEVSIEDVCGSSADLAIALHRQLLIDEALDDKMSYLFAAFDQVFPECGCDISGFRLVEIIGQGAFSRVYLAVDKALGERQVVIKLCHAGDHEAWIQGKLRHDHIMPILSTTEDDEYGLSVICMPFMGRVTLHDKMSAFWTLSSGENRVRAGAEARNEADAICIGKVEDVIRLGFEVGEALAYAHSQGVLHLDLKPSNILIDETGSARLLDFNLSADERRGTQSVGGTLAYMAPEQARVILDGTDGSKLDGRADVFALGTILYEMLCGRLPFGKAATANSARTAMRRQLEQQLSGSSVAWPRGEVDRALRKIVERCLAIDPEHRYLTASAVVRDLRRRQTVVGRSMRWIDGRKRTATAMLVIALVVVSSMLVLIANRDPYPVRQFKAGVACWDAGDLGSAEYYLSQSLGAEGEQAEVMRARAQVRALKGDYHEAIEDLRALGKLRTDGRDVALKAYCCNQIEYHVEAIGFYREAIRLGYATAAVYNNLGYSCYLRARYDEALESLDLALSLRDHASTALYNRAMVHHAMAVTQAVEPLAAIDDIEGAMRLGLCRAESYYCGAVIYGYASSFDNKWKDRARALAVLALQHGISEKAIRSDPSLAAYADDYHASVRTEGTEGSEARAEGVHLILP